MSLSRNPLGVTRRQGQGDLPYLIVEADYDSRLGLITDL